MDDIAPALIDSVSALFRANVAANPKIRALLRKIEGGAATYADVNEYAYQIGKALSKAFGTITSADLPNGKMYFNIADRLIREQLGTDYGLVSEAAKLVAEQLNASAGLGISAAVPPIDEGRLVNMIDRISEADKFDDIAWMLDQPVQNFSMSVVDAVIKANADLHSNAGLHPVIQRRTVRNCCKWCESLAGTYDYPNGAPDDLFRRHENCTCTLEYNPGTGKRQNVWDKSWR